MRPRTPRKKLVPKNCGFCKGELTLHFKEVDLLRRFMSDRSRILAHTRTGVCSKHQRAVAVAIKHARHLSLLPYIG